LTVQDASTFGWLIKRSAARHDARMRELSEKDLGRHIKLLEESTDGDRDELLRDLLVHVYPTKQSQAA
jgi:hypothetical protein